MRAEVGVTKETRRKSGQEVLRRQCEHARETKIQLPLAHALGGRLESRQ